MTTETTAQVTERVVGKVIDRTEDFVQAAATAATNVFEAASNILTTAVEKYGQSVVDAVLWVVRIDALQVLVTAWILVLMVVAMGYFIATGFTRRNWDERAVRHSLEAPLFIGILTYTIIGLITMINYFPTVTNVWLYTAVAKPELYLAKQAVDMVKERLSPKQQPR